MENQFTDDARRWSRLAWAAIVLFAATPAFAQSEEVLQPVGNSGGSPFYARCRAGDVLTGVELWTGDHVDAIKPICIPADAGQFQEYPTRYGGDGGNGPQQFVCPNDSPVVIGMDIAVESAVNNIHLYCGQAIAAPQRAAFPMAAYDGPASRGEESCSWTGSCFSGDPTTGMLRCEAGFIAVGIVGRSGKFLDALGMVCGGPPPPPAPAQQTVKAQGRVKLGGAVPPGPARPICEIASEARARNSPAAPGLEAQCAAERALPPIDLAALHARGAEIAKIEPMAATLRSEQGEGPARRGFEIGLAAAEWNTLPGPGKDRIWTKLSPSEQPAFDTAVAFSLALYKKKLADLALRGKTIAGKDPLSAEFRGLQADVSARRGFEVGLAAAEGQTAPGPGKQKIGAALPPAEQGGYATAVTFSIERNNSPGRAATGAAIAKADPIVGVLRNSEPDALYRLGFDIATGIFGDPKRGAEGKTATGPGSLGLRDSLSPASQRGFNAAVALHLSRKYVP